MNSIKSIIALCTMLCCLPTLAGNNDDLQRRWTTHGPYGGWITSLVASPHPQGGVFTTILGYGVCHLEFGADEWTNISGDLPNLYVYSVEQSSGDPLTIYVGTNDGVYVTFDGGNTWHSRSGGLSVGHIQTIACNPAYPQTLYAGGIWLADWHVYKTTDGGITWTPSYAGIPTGLKIENITIDPVNPNIIYAATQDQNGYVVDEAGVYKSTDGGATWNATGSQLQNKRVFGLTIDPDSNQTLYAGVYAYESPTGGVYISNDAGATWTRSSSGLPDSIVVYQIAKTTGDYGSTILYAAAAYPENIAPSPPDEWEARLYKSTDGGQSWQLASEGITYPNMQAVLADPSIDNTVYAGVNSTGVFRSTNSGEHWTHFSTGLQPLSINDVAIDPLDCNKLYVTAQSRQGLGNYHDAGVFASFDGGQSWTPRSSGIHFTGGFWSDAIAVAPPVDGESSDSLYVAHCGWNGYRSTDQGQSWTWCGGSGGIAGYWSRDVVVDPVNPWIIYVAAAGFEPSWPDVFKSVDCGQTWQSMAGDLVWAEFMSIGIDPTDTQIVYAGSGWEGVWKTTDGGEFWTHTGTEIDQARVNALVVDPADPQTVYAADCSYAGTGVYATSDGGDRWQLYNDGLTTQTVWDLALDSPATGDATLYAGTGGGGVFQRIGAERWTPINTGLVDLTVHSLALAPESSTGVRTLFAGTDYGLYRRVIVGDLNGDGDIDLADLAQLLGNYGTDEGARYEDGDLDGDGDVDLSDLAALLSVYGTIGE